MCCISISKEVDVRIASQSDVVILMGVEVFEDMFAS
jgi:hypothetical protein